MEDYFSQFALLYGIQENPRRAFWLLYATITILSAAVYHLGFAKKLPILKTAVIYVFLLIGCFILTIFGERFPVAECLIVATIVLGGYRLRLRRAKKNGEIGDRQV